MSLARITSKMESAFLISEDAKGSAESEHLLRITTVIHQNVQAVTESKYGRNHTRIISGFICFLKRKDILWSWSEGKTMYCWSLPFILNKTIPSRKRSKSITYIKLSLSKNFHDFVNPIDKDPKNCYINNSSSAMCRRSSWRRFAFAKRFLFT